MKHFDSLNGVGIWYLHAEVHFLIGEIKKVSLTWFNVSKCTTDNLHDSSFYAILPRYTVYEIRAIDIKLLGSLSRVGLKPLGLFFKFGPNKHNEMWPKNKRKHFLQNSAGSLRSKGILKTHTEDIQ